jgi:hypothetical protein
MTSGKEGPARLTVTRQSPKDVQTRQVELSLDGTAAATLMYGDTFTRDITPGPHALRMHNTLVWKTMEFDASPGEHVRYTVVNRTGWGTWWMLSLFGAGPLYLTVVRE